MSNLPVNPWDEPDDEDEVPVPAVKASTEVAPWDTDEDDEDQEELQEETQPEEDIPEGDEWGVIPYKDKIKPSRATLESRSRRIKFLNRLAQTGSMIKAAASISRSVRSVNLFAARNAKFRELIEVAKKHWVEHANDIIADRAMNGYRKGVYFQGNMVDEEIVYDSGLTQFYMKGLDPEKYIERKSVTVEGGITHGVMIVGQQKKLVEWAAQAQEVQDNMKVIDLNPVVQERVIPPVPEEKKLAQTVPGVTIDR